MVRYHIFGARGKVGDPDEMLRRLRSIQEGEVLALDADLVCGEDHLRSAVEHALRSFARHSNSSNNVMLETLLYASGERQIAKAQEKMTVKPEADRTAFVSFGPEPEMVLGLLSLSRDDSVLLCSAEKVLRFGINHEEIEAVGESKAADLVLERVAFVDILTR